MISQLLEQLNPQQVQAVTHETGPLLILAGAGTGKTRVITRRVAYLVLAKKVHPLSILAITFTNKAAKEMRDRVLQWVARDDLWISTFHSMCARILRREIEPLGYGRNFTIYDTRDRDELLKAILNDLGLDTTRYRPSQIGGTISSFKNRLVTPEELAQGGGFAEQLLARVFRRYVERMKDLNALDFDDLLLLTLKLFQQEPLVAQRYAERFEHILIDEFQDTNRVQYLLARYLTSRVKNICICGDPDQSIYRWRGADLQNIFDFETDFKGAKTIKLEQNYRSSVNILGAAEGVIRHNQQRKEKTLWTQNAQGEKIIVLDALNEELEAREIAMQIRSLHEKGYRYSDIAIFYRVNFLQRSLERSLLEFAIPYQIVAGIEFFARREIKDLIAYLRILNNPQDDFSFARIINVPPRGIGQTTLQMLQALAQRHKRSLRDMAAQAGSYPEIAKRAKASLQKLHHLLVAWESLRCGPVAHLVQKVIQDTGLAEFVAHLDPTNMERSENLDEFVAYAQEYDQRQPQGGLDGFLQEVALLADVDGMQDEVDKVTLMTLHAAKGLEFPVVFIAGLEEELLPHARAFEEDVQLEEERRLFYVGLTRAKERLLLAYARSRFHFGAAMPRKASRFLQEIPSQFFAQEQTSDYAISQDAVLPTDADAFQTGDVVKHSHFGIGRVVSLQGTGVNTRIVIHFQRFGTKMLLLPYASLSLVESAS